MKVEHLWWCPNCNHEVVSETYPGNCPKCVHRLADAGYRVGNGKWDFAYYSSRERAMTDRRVK